jgi:CRP-like cAMP-binding protein
MAKPLKADGSSSKSKKSGVNGDGKKRRKSVDNQKGSSAGNQMAHKDSSSSGPPGSNEPRIDDTLERNFGILKSVPKHPRTRKLIKKALNESLFMHQGDEHRDKILKIMYEIKAAAGDTVVNEGDPATNFYVIGSGKFQVSNNGNVGKVLVAGESFNQEVLVRSENQKYTVIALKPGTLWTIDRTTFFQALDELCDIRRAATFMKTTPVFSKVKKEVLLSLAEKKRSLKFSEGQVVARNSGAKKKIYIIESGEAILSVDGKEIKRLSSRCHFVEPDPVIPNGTFTAAGDLKCMAFTANAVEKICGSKGVLIKKKLKDAA